jgi:Domain of unknown function (DUF4832)/Domain of unknown function (DUF4874)
MGGVKMLKARRNILLKFIVVTAANGLVTGLSSNNVYAQSCPVGAPIINTVYTASTETIINPDRGFHNTVSIVTSNKFGAPSGKSAYDQTRTAGMSLLRAIAALDQYRANPLPDAVLNEFRQAFTHARDSGLKIWLAVKYNFPDGPGGQNDPTLNVDAELDVVLNHLDQLKPILEENKDVLAGLYNGFIGAWGEWHSSSTGLDKDPKRRQIYEKMLSVLPADRMMTTRYFEAMNTLADAKPTAQNAYRANGSRMGMANQCYLVSKNDAGTYDINNVDAQKAQVGAWTQFVPFVAETCAAPRSDRRDDCNTALVENELLHLSVLNNEFYKPTLDKWKEQGCYNEINNRLGYRIELKSSSIDATAKAGSAFNASFVVKNVGYAAPYNPRGLALILRHQDTQQIVSLPLRKNYDSTLDPRFWFRESGDITVSVAPTLPADIPAGNYDVLLSLHDPDASLTGRVEYKIRLASNDVWEAATGLNLLVKGVQITR